MAKISWDLAGSRRFETGADRGVLYLLDGSGVPWNGLTSVQKDVGDTKTTPYYFDGIKYLETVDLPDFEATLKAITYPDEFDAFNGIAAMTIGLYANDQPYSHGFGLSYRTLVGNDLLGIDYGYKVHIAYNLTATPSSNNYQSLSQVTNPMEFAWKLSGIPVIVEGHRPTAHITIDSTKLPPEVMAEIEDILYGTETSDPRLPTIPELKTLIENQGLITITDHGDGTWSATGPDENITMLDLITFQIVNADAEYIDADTYTITSN